MGTGALNNIVLTPRRDVENKKKAYHQARKSQVLGKEPSLPLHPLYGTACSQKRGRPLYSILLEERKDPALPTGLGF